MTGSSPLVTFDALVPSRVSGPIQGVPGCSSDASLLLPYSKPSASIKTYLGGEFAGTVDLVGPATDESLRTVKARAEVKNPDGRLLAGMFAAIKLFLPGGDETLAVPRNAVLGQHFQEIEQRKHAETADFQ